MTDRKITYKLKPFLAGQNVADAVDVEIDASGFSGQLDSTVTDVQLLASAFDDLVITPGGGTDPRNIGGPIVPFTSDVTVNSGNYDTYIDAIALYVRADNRLTTFNLPSIADIAGRYPATITILHQGGTDRDAGTSINPSNRVRVPDPDPDGQGLERPSGSALQFFDVRQNDLATFTRASASEPWIVVAGSLTSGALLLPDGLFNLKPQMVRFPTSLNAITGIPTGFVPQAGDAYEVGQDDPTFGGFGVKTGDVIVALIDNPSRLRSADNDDWLVIRNATNSTITLQELRFLNTITEVDSFSDSRLMDRSDVNDVRVFLSTGILDHAPFITPSLDSDNPQASNGASYVGGDELDGSDFEFRDTSNHPTAFVYLDIDGSFNVETNISDVFVVIRDRDGAQVSRFSLENDFRALTLTGSGDTYYVLDHFPLLTDNFSSINYINGYTIDVVHREVTRQFDLGDQVNVIPAISDGSVPIAKLEPNAQALINSDHSLTDEQETILDGFETTSNPTDWTAGDLYVKLGSASPDNVLSDYHNVGQINGILGQHGQTTAITFLVPNFVTVTGLQRTDDTSVKQSVTPIGTVLGRQAFTATLPASTFDINNPVGDAWQVDGTASNRELTGATDSFKIDQSNLDQGLVDRLNTIPTAFSLPDTLATLAHDVTITTTTATEWRELPRAANQPELTRQFAALWDENRRTFGTDNYFDDLTGIQTLGYGGNNIFYYADQLDPLNTAFPGAQSYILNDNIRIRNQSGQSVISDSFQKVIAFDYALQRDIGSSENFSMLRIGGSSTTPLMGLSENEGLYLNIGRGDGGTRTRTDVRNMPVVGSGSISYPFGTVGGVPTIGEAEFVVPNTNVAGLTFPLTATVKVRLDDNGNDEGTFEHTYVITSFDTDQSQTTFTSTHTIQGSPVTQNWNIRTEFNHNHATFGQQDLLFIGDATPLTNNALTYYISVEYSVTTSYNVPATYARYPINAGNGHDDFGVFDPHRYNTEHVRERNRVILLLQRTSITDVSADPELSVRVIVDGEKEGSSDSGYLIDLHRTASEFEFDDMSFGNSICAISHVQCYDYDGGHLIGENSLLDYYNAAANWLGFYNHPTEATDTIGFNGLVEVLPNSDGTARGLIMTDVTTGNRRVIEVDNGALTNKDA